MDQRLILMMDVLEHVDDPVALLASYVASLPHGGAVFVTVPAFQWLWSGHDVFLEHKRRYILQEIESMVKSVGLNVIYGRYLFGLLFPLVIGLRLKDRMRLDSGRMEATSALKIYPQWINRALVLVHDLERMVLLPFNRVAGVTAICLAEKRCSCTN